MRECQLSEKSRVLMARVAGDADGEIPCVYKGSCEGQCPSPIGQLFDPESFDERYQKTAITEY